MSELDVQDYFLFETESSRCIVESLTAKQFYFIWSTFQFEHGSAMNRQQREPHDCSVWCMINLVGSICALKQINAETPLMKSISNAYFFLYCQTAFLASLKLGSEVRL
jgi:hypothetical protein